jgi:hypothetical protein
MAVLIESGPLFGLYVSTLIPDHAIIIRDILETAGISASVDPDVTRRFIGSQVTPGKLHLYVGHKPAASRDLSI